MQLTKGAIGNLINRYKAVLKKCHLMNTFGSLAVAGMLVMGGAGMAVAAGPDVALENGTSQTKYDPTVGANHLMGGWLVNNAETAGKAQGDILLTVNGGTINEIIGGSYAKNLAANEDSLLTVKHGDITTTISDKTTSAEFVVGGSKVAGGAGANLKTGKTTLTIENGTFGKSDKADNYELVMGGNYAKTAGSNPLTATTKGSSVTVNGGTSYASVVGGSVAHNYSKSGSITVTDNGATSVTINDGTFNPSKSTRDDINGGINLSAAVIGGGLAYGANTNSVLGSKEAPVTSRVTINGGTFEPGANSGHYAKIVAGSVVANNGGTAIVHGNTTLAMADGAAHDDLIGGGMVENAATLPKNSTSEYNLNITGDSSVKVTGGNAQGEVIGGNYVKTSTAGLENSAKVANSSVTITGGTFADVEASTNKAQYIIGGSKTNASGGGNATTLVEGNSSVLIDGDVTIADGALIGGSQAKAGNGAQSQATATVKGNSSVTVNNGTLAGVIGGGIAETYAQNVTAESTVNGTSSVTINGGNVTGNSIETGAVAGNTRKLSAAVVGGGLANDTGSTATVGSTSVAIAEGTINGKVVAGGAAVNGGKAEVKGDTSLTMTGGKVDGDLIGGGFVDKNNAKNNQANVDGSTHITVSGGSLVDAEIIGGGSVRNATGEANVTGDTHVTVTKYANDRVDQKWVQYVLGGGKAMTSGQQQTATAKVTGSTNVTIGEQGAIGEDLDIQFGTVAGGGLARAQEGGGSAIATVDNANVTVHSGILSGVAGGGIAESYGNNGTADATVTNANLTINGGTINGVKYSGVNNSAVAVLGGGIAKGTKATANATTTNTVINGGTINGHVVAGGLADGGTATVGTANLTINGGTINGNVYAGGYALNKGTADVTTANVTLKGGSINGKVTVGNATNATITLDGTGAKVTGDDTDDFEGNKSSTLAFNNYNGTFEKVAIGFGTLAVAENSNVYVDALVSGQRGSDRPNTGFFGAPTPTDEGTLNPTGSGFTITGGGTITAKEFHVNPDASVMIEHGNVVADDVKVQGATLTVGEGSASAGFTANKDLSFEQIDDKPLPSIVINNLGTATLSQTVVLNDKGGIDTRLFDHDQIQVNTGGTLRLDGLEGPLTKDELAALKATTKGGLLDIGGATIADVATGEDGNYAYSDVSGITSDQFINAGVAVNDSEAGTGISGGFKNVALTGTAAELGVNGTLQLAGSTAGGNLVATNNGDDPGDLNVHNGSVATLGREDANNQGTLGDVTLNASGILNVIGQGRAEFTTGNIVATGGGTTAVVNVSGATLNTQQIDPTNGLSKLNITNGAVHAAGDVNVKDLALAGGVLAAHEAGGAAGTPGGDITLGTLSGQGSVVADKTLTVTNAYTGVDTDALALQANELTTANFVSTKGDVVIKAAKWDANGATTLKGDTVVLTGAGTFTGNFAMDGGALVAQNENADAPATLTFNDDVTFTNGTVAVVDSIKMNGTNTSLTVGEADSDGVSLVVKEMTTAGTGALTFDPDWGYASNNAAIEKLNYNAITDSNAVNNALQVGRNSYVALGTTDKGWLPSVVQGGLREDGVETVLGLAKPLVVQSTGSIELNSDAGYVAGSGWASATNTATFGANSLLVVNGANIYGGDKAAISFETPGALSVDAGAKLLVTDAVAGQDYTIVGNVNDPAAALAGWKNNGMTSTTDMISLGDAVFTPGSTGTTTPGKVTTSAVRNDAHTVFPNLSDGMANAVNDLYTGHAGAAGQPNWDYADVNSDQMGVRFLSRATDNRFLGMDKNAAAESIESAARIAFAGAVPQMTKMASDAGTNAVVNRLGFADPADGAQAMDAEGKIVDRNTTGFALWIAPLWQSQHGWGLDAGNMDYGFNGNLGGVSLGADYTFENAIRAGITFNIGGGYAESSGGDLSSTDNRMNFWGLGAYAGWNYENFGVMADVSYTSTWNDLKQDVDSRMGMGDLEADVQATAISAGLRAEYLLQTSAMDIIPHIGVRYMSLNTWGYDVDTHGGTVLEGDSLHQDIWTFPIGVTFSKDIALDSGWNFKPSLDFSVIPAAGDIKAKHDVHFTGLPGTYEVETQMMDYLTWQGGVGLELANDNMSIGVNYTLQAGQHTTGHGVFGSFRYEF